MKHTVIITAVITLAINSQLVTAGSVTDAYATGDTLTATKMSAIKTAINDNNTKVSTNAASISNNAANISSNTSDISAKQNRISASCPPGQSIRVINVNGTVSCEVDTDTNTNTTYSAGRGINITGTTISARIGADIIANVGRVGIAKGNTAITRVASVTITAPSSGYVLVTHSGDVTLFGEPNTVKVGIGDTTTAMDTGIFVGSLDISSTGRYHYGYTAQYLYPVTAGNHTYSGLAQKNTTFNAGSANVNVQSLSAIFIPSRY